MKLEDMSATEVGASKAGQGCSDRKKGYNCWLLILVQTRDTPPPNHCIVGTIAPQHSAVTLWFSNLDFLCFALQCRCALMCCFSCPIISMPAMGQLIQFIHDIPFREINVLKTKSCFEMVSSISLFGSTFTIFILFRTNTKTTTETEEMQLIQCNGQCTKPIG